MLFELLKRKKTKTKSEPKPKQEIENPFLKNKERYAWLLERDVKKEPDNEWKTHMPKYALVESNAAESRAVYQVHTFQKNHWTPPQGRHEVFICGSERARYLLFHSQNYKVTHMELLTKEQTQYYLDRRHDLYVQIPRQMYAKDVMS